MNLIFPTDRLPYAFGEPLATGSLRERVADFVVDELLDLKLAGEGEHAYLQIKKTDINTRDVVHKLGRLAGVRERSIGYSGLKDRHAIATQWFSVHLPGKPDPDWQSLLDTKIELLQVARHTRKLRRAEHRANRFSLTIRGIATAEHAEIVERLTVIGSHGVPNYFGEQRFGNAGDNVYQALRMFQGERKVAKGWLRNMLLASARSFIFNEVVGARVQRGDWHQLIEGDVMIIPGEDRLLGDEELNCSLVDAHAQGLIDSSAILWGRGELRTSGVARKIEEDVVGRYAELAAGLEAAGLSQQRRPMRLRPAGLEWQVNEDNLVLTFELPVGAYATSLVREVVQTNNNRMAAA